MRYTGGVRFVKTRGLSQNGKARNGMGVEINWLDIWFTMKKDPVKY